jgi:hypothetical protein
MSCMATTTHTIVVKLSHEVIISRSNDLFLSPRSLLHIIKNFTWHCMRQPIELLTCSNLLALIAGLCACLCVYHRVQIIPT